MDASLESSAGPEHGQASSRAALVRSFFRHLEAEGLRAAVLHGWEGDFEGELSDIDFVIGPEGFARLVRLIRRHADVCGWRLCQVFRHETTAAYFICASRSDPSVVVALDACTDYQRHGVAMIAAGELLATRQSLPWGGFRLGEVMEFAYRLLKAVAKGKDPGVIGELVARAPAPVLEGAARWLQERHGVPAEPWDEAALARVRDQLGGRMRRRPSLWQRGSLRRIAGRLRSPDGLVVCLGPEDFAARGKALAKEAGPLFFRRAEAAGRFAPRHGWTVMRSGLLVVPAVPWMARRLLPADTVMELKPDAGLAEIADFLEARQRRREP